MGYTTDFYGEFGIDKPLTKEHFEYLETFSRTRRMKRDSKIAETLPDPIRIAAGLPIGEEGGYFVGSPADFGQSRDASVVNYNSPPADQPGLWCQWIPEDVTVDVPCHVLRWDGGEKFYDYVEWLGYLIEHFFKPWGYVLNGEVNWQGEDSGDLGLIVVEDNKITVKTGRVIYE